MPFDVHAHAGRLEQIARRLAVGPPPQDGPDARGQLAVAERLGDVVVGAEFEAHDLVDLVVAGGHHDDRDAAALPQPPADLDAGQAGHHQVEQDDVRAVPVEQGQPLLAVGGGEDLEALLGEHVAQGVAIGRLVLDDQDRGHSASWVSVSWASGMAAGSRRVNVEPAPSLLQTLTVPPWPAAISWTIDRPSPVPPLSRLRA